MIRDPRIATLAQAPSAAAWAQMSSAEAAEAERERPSHGKPLLWSFFQSRHRLFPPIGEQGAKARSHEDGYPRLTR